MTDKLHNKVLLACAVLAAFALAVCAAALLRMSGRERPARAAIAAETGPDAGTDLVDENF